MDESSAKQVDAFTVGAVEPYTRKISILPLPAAKVLTPEITHTFDAVDLFGCYRSGKLIAFAPSIYFANNPAADSIDTGQS